MKRSLAKYLSHFEGVDINIQTIKIEIPDAEVDDSKLRAVFNEIFAVDPISGFPRGDIQYFMSEDANPVVKQWLLDNLLSPRAKQTGSSIEGVTDDMIVEMSRKDGESVGAYQHRLIDIFESAKSEYEKGVSQLNIKTE